SPRDLTLPRHRRRDSRAGARSRQPTPRGSRAGRVDPAGTAQDGGPAPLIESPWIGAILGPGRQGAARDSTAQTAAPGFAEEITAMASKSDSGRKRHLLSALVQNQPGVLAQVSGMFASRGFNIESLAVGETEDPHLSRITVVVMGDDRHLEQVRKQ